MHAIFCVGQDNLPDILTKVKLEDSTATVSKNIKETSFATEQDIALYNRMQLMCEHNLPLYNINDDSFSALLNYAPMGYDTFADISLQTSYNAEKKC